MEITKANAKSNNESQHKAKHKQTNQHNKQTNQTHSTSNKINIESKTIKNNNGNNTIKGVQQTNRTQNKFKHV